MSITSLIQQLERDEDIRAFVYDDATGIAIKPGTLVKGNPTIGVGRSLNIDGLSKDEIAYLLSNDERRITQECEKEFPWAMGLDEVRREVLLNMIFQMGAEGLAKFKQFLAAMIRGDYDEAAKDMLDSSWAQHESPARAQRLSVQIKTGVRQ
jgi:lysozyme